MHICICVYRALIFAVLFVTAVRFLVGLRADYVRLLFLFFFKLCAEDVRIMFGLCADYVHTVKTSGKHFSACALLVGCFPRLRYCGFSMPPFRAPQRGARRPRPNSHLAFARLGPLDVYIYIYIHTHTYIYIYIYTYVYVYLSIYISLSLYIYIHIYIYIHYLRIVRAELSSPGRVVEASVGVSASSRRDFIC